MPACCCFAASHTLLAICSHLVDRAGELSASQAATVAQSLAAMGYAHQRLMDALNTRLLRLLASKHVHSTHQQHGASAKAAGMEAHLPQLAAWSQAGCLAVWAGALASPSLPAPRPQVLTVLPGCADVLAASMTLEERVQVRPAA
jgi:hypothetical protein